MSTKGTIIPLPPSQARLEAAKTLETPEAFVPDISVSHSKWSQGSSGGGPSRAMVPVGTVGALGAAYTIFEKNWRCDECETENAASRARCVRCRARKPANAAGVVHGGAAPEAAAAQQKQEGNTPKQDDNAVYHGEWREIFDASARHIYYHNAMTGESRWDRPVEMGPTPHSSGWFGRGAAGSTALEGYERNNASYLLRPARKQVDYVAARQSVLEGAYEYNIWWGKHVGDHWSQKDAQREPAETRCVLATDAGFTKADGKPGSHSQKRKGSSNYATANFCLFFARGCCAAGADCRYFHRIPVKDDLERFAKDETHDIFGRERHRDFRDDMTGVGSMTKPCRTLFVGALLKSEYENPRALEETLWRNFGEWGELENVNLVSRLSICFVRYRYRSSAEFAKEAMSNNKLDRDENLNVRWAHDDPNPVAKDASNRADADALVEMLNAQGVQSKTGAAEKGNFETPSHYAASFEPARKKLKSSDSSQDLFYPDTSDQYDDENTSAARNNTAADRAKKWTAVADADGSTYWWNRETNETTRDAPARVADANADRALAALDAADRALAESSGSGSGLPDGWATATDDASGATYYFNAATGDTSWTLPAATPPPAAAPASAASS